MGRGLALLALALLTGCGSLARSTLAGHELDSTDDPARLTTLRGSDPLLPAVWHGSAQRQPTPQAALDIVQRGLRFHPGQPNLVWDEVTLFANMGRREEQVAAARAALAQDPPPELQAVLRQLLVDGRLALDDPAGAEQEAVRLGGVSEAPRREVAAAWAAVALSYEFLGQASQADHAFEESLDLGPQGVATLRALAAETPERSAAAQQLVERAVERHPNHPDLQQFLVVAQMLAKDYAGAEQRLDDLPQPLPPRMGPDVAALHARLDLLQGRLEQGLSRLRARLDRAPADLGALAVLLECWHTNGQPTDAEMLARLRAARGAARDEGLARQIEAMLQQFEQSAAPKQDAPAATP